MKIVNVRTYREVHVQLILPVQDVVEIPPKRDRHTAHQSQNNS